MSKPVVEISHLKTILGNATIHEDINLTINQGEIFAIVGGSGAGKTTLLKTILGLVPVHSGDVIVAGYNLKHISSRKYRELCQHWGILFQSGALFSSLTVLDNVAYLLHEYTNLPKQTINELALLKISLVGLPISAAIKYPAELSGGMIKRVALARALCLDPKIVFLDEPTAGLDPESVESLDMLIRDLRDLFGLTVVLVTHDLRTLWQISDRVGFLADGKLLAVGTVKEVSANSHPMIHNYFHDPDKKDKRLTHGDKI